MVVRVTFDSNVWESIVDAEMRIKDDSEREPFVRIRSAIEQNRMAGYICDAVANLEAIKIKERAAFFSGQKLQPTLIRVAEDTVSVSMAPSQEHRKDLMPVLADRLSRAVSGGFRLMRFPQHGTPLLPASYYSDEPEGHFEKSCEINAAILERGVGKSIYDKLALKLAAKDDSRGGHFFGLPDVAMTVEEEKAVSTAVAEWADGETVACHFAFGNDILCTGDVGGRHGKRQSILNDENRIWLAELYGFRFSDVLELCSKL
jgi:hypothetical protein